MRQYRPALEAFSWELPAGLRDPGESPAEACRRELLEETGLTVREIYPLGENSPCTGRLANRIHSFFVEAGDPVKGFKPEAGITVKLVSPAEVVRLITSGGFDSQLHLGALLLAELHGFLVLLKRREGRTGARPRTRGPSSRPRLQLPRCRSCDRTRDPVETTRKRKAGGIVCDPLTEIRESPAENVDSFAVHPSRHDQ